MNGECSEQEDSMDETLGRLKSSLKLEPVWIIQGLKFVEVSANIITNHTTQSLQIN